MTVVVTGAAGHVGANLVRALIDRNTDVRALVHVNRRALAGLDVETVTGDVSDPVSLVEAFTGAEVVYHLAADIPLSNNHWSEVAATNIIGTRNVVGACLRCGVRRLVHLSSIHAMIPEPLDVAVDESRKLVGSGYGSVYDRSKAAGEREIFEGIAAGLNAVIISPTAIIGPYDYQPSHIGTALLAMAGGRLPALVAGGFDWVDVRDVVEGAIRAEARAPAGAKYILSGHWRSVPQMAALVAEATGVAAPGFVCPMWLARAAVPVISRIRLGPERRPLYTDVSLQALCSHRYVSHARATNELDYQPRPFERTIVDTLKWFQGVGQLPPELEIKMVESS